MLARTPKTKLTDSDIAKLPLAGTPGAPTGDKYKNQYVVRLAPGFYVRSGRTSRAYTAQADATVDGQRKSFKTVLGRTDEMTMAAAGRAAQDFIIGIKRRTRLPEAKAPKGITLSEAWQVYRRRCEAKQRRPSTIDQYEQMLRGPLAAFRDVPLSVLGEDATKLTRWHETETTKRGPYRANLAGRTLSAIYRNAAKKIDRTLPPCPTDAIEWNPEEVSQGGLGLSDLSAWGEQWRALQNPIRREFALWTLLSGSRPDALARARWTDINRGLRTLHIPSPKGGPKKAFSIPLSREMVRSLVRVRRAGRIHYPNSQWIFPAASHEGHITCWKEDRRKLSAYGRDLRHTFRTVCAELGINKLFSMALMNHTVGGDVHDRYIVRGKLSKALHDAQQEVSTAIWCRIAHDNVAFNK